MHEQSTVFLSYSRKNLPQIAQLYSALTKVGVAVWIDWEDIPKAEPWKPEVAVGIQQSDYFIPVLTLEYLMSKPCEEELEIALDLNKKIVPLVFDPTIRDNGHRLPNPLREINWIFFDKAFEIGLNDLLGVFNRPYHLAVDGSLVSCLSVINKGLTPAKERRIKLWRRLFVVGRAPQVTRYEAGIITFIDNTLLSSRNQFTLWRQEGRWLVRDGLSKLVGGSPRLFKPSANGTSLNGRKLSNEQWVPLINGDILTPAYPPQRSPVQINFFEERGESDQPNENDPRETQTEKQG